MTMHRLAEHLGDELASVPAASGSLKMVHRRARRRRLTRVLASLATTVVVLIIAVMVFVPSLPRIAVAEGPDAPTVLLIDGEVEIPITDQPIAEVENAGRTLTVFGGLSSPAPEFDTSALGEEQALVPNDPAWDPSLDPGPVPVVYLGDVAGHAAFVHTNDILDAFDRVLFEMANDGPIGPHLCVTVWDGATNGGGSLCTSPGTTLDQRSTSGILNQSAEGDVGQYVTWIGLPSATSVVSLELEDGTRLWQKPYGETVVFILDEDKSTVATLSALNSKGITLNENQVGVRVGND